MALDTKYRPQTYDEVLGQEASVAVLCQFVKEGLGFHQSYVFCGQHGSGKTTLGRILARALLCESPVEGAPCDACTSCKVLLEGGSHECFEELDAATKSGKADLARIIEDVTYATFSGKRRIYLFDESHRLSKQALDVLLKPMEDTAPGSEDKRLVCIFCTTEPEKMSSTIFSRCAPAFVVRSAPHGEIVSRLTDICQQEGIDGETDALDLIVEQSESHIRDALKMVEGISMLGGVTRENVARYLHLEANERVLSLLEALGSDLKAVVSLATELAREMSPSVAYGRLAEAAMVVYRCSLGVGEVPTRWDVDRVKELSAAGFAFLNVATRFAAPPHRPTRHTLVLDAASSHHYFGGGPLVDPAIPRVAAPSPTASLPPSPDTSVHDLTVVGKVERVGGKVENDSDAATTTTTGVWVDPRAIGPGPEESGASQPEGGSETLPSDTFRELVRHHLRRLTRGRRRTGRDYLGGA